MAVYFYSFYTLSYVGLLIYNLFIYRRTRRISTALLSLNAFGLLWENGVIAAGQWLGPGTLLQVLNMGRYCLHFSMVPLMAWPLLEQLRLAGHAWAGARSVRALIITFIIALIFSAFFFGTPGLYASMQPVNLGGMLRYTGTSLASALVAIAIMAMALVTGFLLWRGNKWPWLFLSALLAFLVEGLLRNQELLSLVAGNGAEVLFQLTLLQTELFVTRFSTSPRTRG